MKAEQFQEYYGNLVNNMLFGKELSGNLSRRFYNTYFINTPRALQGTLRPEADFFASLLDNLSPDLERIEGKTRENIGRTLTNSPSKFLLHSLVDFVSFPRDVNSHKFSYRVKDAIEDTAYAAEVGTVKVLTVCEMYRKRSIFEKMVERHTREFFYKNVVKGFFESEGIPTNDQIKKGFGSLRDLTIGLLEAFMLTSFERSSERDVKERYHRRMAGISCERNNFAYKYEGGLYNDIGNRN